MKGKGVGDFILALCHMFLTVEWRCLKVVVSAASQIEICDTRGTSGTESVKFIGFYEVKNARLMDCRVGETVVQREAEFGLRDTAVHHLIYDWKKKMRGMANSKTYEKPILCWKGKFPSGLPKDRQSVDVGSDLTYMDKAVLAESLKTMCGLSEEVTPEEPGTQPVAESVASTRPLQEHVKKRRLYRTATDESVV